MLIKVGIRCATCAWLCWFIWSKAYHNAGMYKLLHTHKHSHTHTHTHTHTPKPNHHCHTKYQCLQCRNVHSKQGPSSMPITWFFVLILRAKKLFAQARSGRTHFEDNCIGKSHMLGFSTVWTLVKTEVEASSMGKEPPLVCWTPLVLCVSRPEG